MKFFKIHYLYLLLFIPLLMEGYTIELREKSSSINQPQKDSLESRFIYPPTFSCPYVWWHWMGSNYSKEGITKDFVAMKETGIGTATIFNIASSVQETHVPILNNPWPFPD